MLQIDLSNHLALITGASGELGRAMARTLARCGAGVAVHYLQSKDKADALCAELHGMGARSLAVQADVGDLNSVMRMRDAVQGALGAPDIVVANAVIQYRPWTTVLEQPAEDYESQFRSCVLHNVFLAKAFLPAMIEKRWGRYIGINTECAIQCHARQSAYDAAKRGMDGVLRVLAREAGPHQITVNQIAPGYMISEKHRTDGRDEKMKDDPRIPMGRHGDDQDIANAVAFLASNLAGFITGAFLPVCGGNVMTAI